MLGLGEVVDGVFGQGQVEQALEDGRGEAWEEVRKGSAVPGAPLRVAGWVHAFDCGIYGLLSRMAAGGNLLFCVVSGEMLLLRRKGLVTLIVSFGVCVSTISKSTENDASGISERVGK